SWQAEPGQLSLLQPLIDELRNLTYGAAHAYLPPMAGLGEKLQQVYLAIMAEQLHASDQLCSILNQAHANLLDMVDAVAAGQNLGPIPEDIEQSLNGLIDQATSQADAYQIDMPEVEELDTSAPDAEAVIVPEAESEDEQEEDLQEAIEDI